jgi:hypothetical protein
MYDKYKHILQSDDWGCYNYETFEDEIKMADHEERILILKALKEEDFGLKIERCLEI